MSEAEEYMAALERESQLRPLSESEQGTLDLWYEINSLQTKIDSLRTENKAIREENERLAKSIAERGDTKLIYAEPEDTRPRTANGKTKNRT